MSLTLTVSEVAVSVVCLCVVNEQSLRDNAYLERQTAVGYLYYELRGWLTQVWIHSSPCVSVFIGHIVLYGFL